MPSVGSGISSGLSGVISRGVESANAKAGNRTSRQSRRAMMRRCMENGSFRTQAAFAKRQRRRGRLRRNFGEIKSNIKEYEEEGEKPFFLVKGNRQGYLQSISSSLLERARKAVISSFSRGRVLIRARSKSCAASMVRFSPSSLSIRERTTGLEAFSTSV